MRTGKGEAKGGAGKGVPKGKGGGDEENGVILRGFEPETFACRTGKHRPLGH